MSGVAPRAVSENDRRQAASAESRRCVFGGGSSQGVEVLVRASQGPGRKGKNATILKREKN